MQHELWAESAAPPTGSRSSEPDVYLAVCSMYRNEAAYLAEWIEFHMLVGVERFFLYDNDSDDEHLEVLAPYLEQGIAVRHEWPGSASSQADVCSLQVGAYNHCISTHGEEARWTAFIDTDEFLFSPTARPVPEMLAEQARWPGIAVNSIFIGASGHVTRPTGLVLENYARIVETDSTRSVKVIVDPIQVTRCVSAHEFAYANGLAVDENGYPVAGARTKSTSVARLRINHYFGRSEEDVRAKHTRRVADRGAGSRSLPSSQEIQRKHSSGPRDYVIQRYLPLLREALARRAGAVPQS
jgi:hypothetical protein